MCQECVDKLNESQLFKLRIHPPDEILKMEVVPIRIQDMFKEARAAFDNYVANLGSEAVEHNKESFNFSGYGRALGRRREIDLAGNEL